MGWSYKDWRGVFYEAGLSSEKMLEQYVQVFPTVELDTTFYGVPRPSTLDGWVAQVPDGFLFSAKVPRAVTHERRLVGAGEAALDFGTLLHQHLGKHLGGLLLQLPPDFTSDERAALDTFIDAIASPRRQNHNVNWVVEFRHASWKDTDIVAALQERGIACATSERLDLGGPLRYVRLLGTENAVARFDETQIDRTAELAQWAERIASAAKTADSRPLFVYIRNFYEGHAPASILRLREHLGLPIPVAPGQQQMSLF